jgi:hypothetical protein
MLSELKYLKDEFFSAKNLHNNTRIIVLKRVIL